MPICHDNYNDDNDNDNENDDDDNYNDYTNLDSPPAVVPVSPLPHPSLLLLPRALSGCDRHDDCDNHNDRHYDNNYGHHDFASS